MLVLWLVLLVGALVPVARAASNGAPATYVGGTVGAFNVGSDCRLDLTDEIFLSVLCIARYR